MSVRVADSRTFSQVTSTGQRRIGRTAPRVRRRLIPTAGAASLLGLRRFRDRPVFVTAEKFCESRIQARQPAASQPGVGWPAVASRGIESPGVTLQSGRISLRSMGVKVKRSDGAKSWSRVLSELAQVRVSVEWERPTWRVSWQDGPTREALMGRAAALGDYRVGSPLPFEDLQFARSSSSVAIALEW